MKRGSFVDVLYAALSKKKSVQLVFFGPSRSGVVIVKIREGRILSVDSTWGGGRKELSKLFLWGSGEYAEKPLHATVRATDMEGEAMESLTAEDVAGLEKDDDLYAVLKPSTSSDHAVEDRGDTEVEVRGEAASMERGIELLEMIQTVRPVEANRYELFDAMVSHFNLSMTWIRRPEHWALAKEVFRDVYRKRATGLLQGRSSKGQIWGVFLGGTVVGAVFWKTAVDEIREGKAALHYVHLLSTVDPMEWRFYQVDEDLITALGVFFAGTPVVTGWMPAGSLWWWVERLEQGDTPGDLFYVLVGSTLQDGLVILRDSGVQGIRQGKVYTRLALEKLLHHPRPVQVWGFAGDLGFAEETLSSPTS